MARILMVSSTQDIAGQMMDRYLRTHFPFIETSQLFDNQPVLRLDPSRVDSGTEVKLAVSHKELFESEHLESQLSADAIICLSRHKSQSNTPGLLVHSPGNWGNDSSLGGEPNHVAVAPGVLIRAALRLLDKAQQHYALASYPVTMEVTHHGPTSMSTPLIFVEVGSTPVQWRDPAPTQAVAEVAYQLATTYPTIIQEPVIPVLGVGGTHYCPGFNKLVRETDYATTHIIPKYHVDALTLDAFKNAISRSRPVPQTVVVDWKGLNGPQRDKIIGFVEQLSDQKLELLRLNKLLKQDDP